MKVSTRGRYALRIMTELAKAKPDEYISLNSLSEKQSISQKYLEQIVPLLTRAGFIKSTRGNKGGYSLKKNPDKITVGDILRATEGSLAPVPCVESKEENTCEKISYCTTYKIWFGLYEVINNYLDGITLKQIIDNTSEEITDDYCI
ncbi:MAG: Rrf2 family transcriptional regulator [Ruminococcus sp.]|nr:Rrf2 family transcriptional regulator [Ruminococcus sp.]